MYMVAVINTTLLLEEGNTTSVEVRDMEVESGGPPVLPFDLKLAIQLAAAEDNDSLGLRTVQNMPDLLSRELMTVVHPASVTPEPANRCRRAKLEGGACVRHLACSRQLRCGSSRSNLLAGRSGLFDSMEPSARASFSIFPWSSMRCWCFSTTKFLC